jgi:hypothetical protein
MQLDQTICPRCNTEIGLPNLNDNIVDPLDKAHIRNQKQLSTNPKSPLTFFISDYYSPAKRVLMILRSYQADCPQWFSIHKVYYCCIMAGLLPDEVRKAIDALTIEGFIEKREDAIRAIPIN